MPALTRGPLPASVYWRRRLVLVSVVCVLALGIAGVTGLLGGDDGPQDQARTAAAEREDAPEEEPTDDSTEDAEESEDAGDTEDGEPTEDGSETPEDAENAEEAEETAAAEDEGEAAEKDSTEDVSADETSEGEDAEEPGELADPDGACADGEVLLTPKPRNPVAGQDVRFVLHLQAHSTPACLFDLSAESVTVKITSGNDEIWSSLDCPEVIPEKSVVVRRDRTTRVPMVWNSRRSDPECTNRTAWALPGDYHILAAALASEPTDVQFRLRRP